MDERSRGPRSVPNKGSAEDRLQSWKEIAAYLGRDARSVYRWEKTENLPVHRLQHEKHGSVYAFKSELDAWVAARSAESHRKGPGGRRVPWAVAAAGLGVLGAGVWLAVPWRIPSCEPPSALPFSSSPGVELQPHLSPDAQQVAFSWNGDGRKNFDIYIKLVTGDTPLQLTHDPADEYSPAWSPDGAAIAFLRRKDVEHVRVVVIPALGGAERPLAELESGARLDWSRPGPFLTWSRDGKWLVTCGRLGANSPDRLLRISVATGDMLPLTEPPPGIQGDSAPALSHDGRALAFTRRISWGASDLCLLPVTGELTPMGEVRRLDTGSQWNASPAWLPDSKSLLFSRGSMESPHLAKISVSGRARATRISGFGSHGWQPSLAITRQGKVRLIYTQHFESVNLWRVPLDHAGVTSRAVTSAHWSYEPDYSPDGSRIALLSDRSGYVEIWVTRGDGTDPRQWTFLKQSSLGSPRWSPDGRRIAFTMPGPGGSTIHWIDAPGAGPRAVPDSTPSGYFAWAPDGQSIYFTTTRRQATNIWRALLNGATATQVTTQSPSRVPAVSLDGRFLFFLRLISPDGANDLFRVPLAGGEEEKVLSYVDAYSVCQTGVAYKYYRPGSNPDGPHLKFYRFSTGGTETLPAVPMPLRYGVAASPDCRHLVYAQADYEVSDLMLVDGLR